MYLVMKWLLHSGYVDTCTSLQNETRTQQDRFELADNMDLEIILADFEQNQQVRYGKTPKIIKKMEPMTSGSDSRSKLPKTSRSRAGSKEPNRTSTNLSENKENLSSNGSQTTRDTKNKSSTNKENDKDNKENNENNNLEMNGVNINTAQNTAIEKTNNKNVKSSAEF